MISNPQIEFSFLRIGNKMNTTIIKENVYYNDNLKLFNILNDIVQNQYHNKIQKLIKNNLELQQWIDDVLERKTNLNIQNFTLKTKINWILNNIISIPKCHFCHKDLKLNSVSYNNNYNVWCSAKCRANDDLYKEIYSKSLETKYGQNIKYSWQIPGVKEKSQITLINNYGKEPFKSKIIRQKVEQTFFKHYGTTHNMKSKKGMEEYKKAMQEKYGCDYTWQVSSIKEKVKETNLKKHGVDIASKLPEVKEKQAKTNLERYGTITPLLNEDIKNKTKKTNLKKYGVEHYSQNHEVHLKQIRNYYVFNNEKFNSSWELAFWIFHIDHNIPIEHEPLALNYVDEKNKSHRYFPDFKVNDQLIEIKGDDQFDKDGNLIDKLNHKKNYICKAKQMCMIQNNVKILTYKEIKPYLIYIDNQYGKKYLKQFKM